MRNLGQSLTTHADIGNRSQMRSLSLQSHFHPANNATSHWPYSERWRQLVQLVEVLLQVYSYNGLIGLGCSSSCKLLPRVCLRTSRLTFIRRALLGFTVYGMAIIAVPADDSLDPHGKVDWIGSYLGVAGLLLFNFVWKYVGILYIRQLQC